MSERDDALQIMRLREKSNEVEVLRQALREKDAEIRRFNDYMQDLCARDGASPMSPKERAVWMLDKRDAEIERLRAAATTMGVTSSRLIGELEREIERLREGYEKARMLALELWAEYGLPDRLKRGLQEPPETDPDRVASHPPDNCPPPECLCSEQWASELCPRHKHLDPDNCPPEE